MNNFNLLEYQQVHFNILKNAIIKYSRALDASDTGTGKTYVSIKLCLELNLIPWVVCPKSVISAWTRIIESAGIKNYNVISYEKLYSSDKYIKITGNPNDYNNYIWQFGSNPKLQSTQNYLFIYDEAHKCKNLNTYNCKNLLSLSKLNVKIILLSATIIDKPGHFMPYGIVLKLYSTLIEGSYWVKDILGKHNKSTFLTAVHDEIFEKYASRMRISDTTNIFKNNKVYYEGIFMENYWEIDIKYEKIKKLLEKQEKNKIKKITNENSDSDIENSDNDLVDLENIEKEQIETLCKKNKNILAEITILRMEIELLRIDKIVELTYKFLNQNKSVVIFVNYIDTILKLSSRLNCDCIVWGSQSLKKRTISIDNFCSDKSRIIICNIQCGSTGISLHDMNGHFSRVSIISPTWSAQNLLQSLGRIHRAMGKTDCEQYIIYCKDTIEESVGNSIKNKINNIKQFNDGNKQLKNENIDVILKEDIKKKNKTKELNEYMYKVNDFDAIQTRIDNLENLILKLNKELDKYCPNTNNYKECEYRIIKVQNELDYNLKKINETIEIMTSYN